MKTFPKIELNTLNDVINMVDYINKERPRDVADWDNLKNIFMSGRKVGKIPSAAIDVADADRIGDFNYDTDYLYILVPVGAGAEWRRASLGSW